MIELRFVFQVINIDRLCRVLFQKLDDFKCGVNVALNLKFACCESYDWVKFAVYEFDEICAVHNENCVSVVILIRLNMYLAVLNFYIENTINGFALDINLECEGARHGRNINIIKLVSCRFND